MAQSTNTRLVSELTRARAVQLGMLPDPPVVQGLQFHVHYSACDGVGGDFYDFLAISPSELGIVVADVSGHGLDAALLMAAAKKSIQIHARGQSSPAKTLGVVCRDLAAELPKNSFITVFYGIIDLASWELRFASAGHNPPLFLHEGKLTKTSAKGMVISGTLSKMFDASIEEKTVRLREGMSIVLYTDGVTESMNPEGKEFGESELDRVLRKHAEHAPYDLCDSVIAAVETFSNGAPQADDMTLLCIRCAGLEAATVSKTASEDGLRWGTNITLGTRKLVGRERLVSDVRGALSEHPIISLVAPGGIGKTAVASEVGRVALEQFPGGAWLVDCSAAADIEQAAGMIARTLRIDVPAGSSYMDALPVSLSLRQQTLLVMDNIGSLEGWIDYAQVLQRQVKSLRIIQTAHSRAGAGEAKTFVLSPLAVPPMGGRVSREELLDYDSVKCFVECVKFYNPEYDFSDSDYRHIAGVCRELEGIPQAIELAAGAIEVVPLSGIYKAVRTHSHKLAALGSAGVDTESLRRSVHLTYSQLDETTRSALGMLSVTRGGFDLEAASAILGDRVRSAVDVISKLLRSGVASRTATPYGARFHLNTMVANIARDEWEKSASDEDKCDARARMVEHYAETATALRDQLAYNGERRGTEAVEQLHLEARNHDVALSIAIEDKIPVAACRLALAIRSGRAYHGDFRGTDEILVAALECVGDGHPQQRALLLESRAIGLMGGTKPDEEVVALCEEALELESNHTFEQPLIGTLKVLAMIYSYRQDIEKCDKYMEMAFERQVASDKPAVKASAYLHKGSMLRMTGRDKEALKYYKMIEEVDPELNNPYAHTTQLIARSMIHAILGHHKKAIELCSKGVKIARTTQSRAEIAFAATRVAGLYTELGQPDKSLDKYIRAEEVYGSLGMRGALMGVWSGHALSLLALDEVPEALRMAMRTIEEARRQMDVTARHWCAKTAYIAAICEMELGNYAESHKLAAESREAYEGNSNQSGLVAYHALEACLCWLDGEKERAARDLAKTREAARETPSADRSLLVLLAAARALVSIDVRERARSQVLLERAEVVYQRYRDKRLPLTVLTNLTERLIDRARKALGSNSNPS
jgi:tetratricopeptide (TPR) repeat protein